MRNEAVGCSIGTSARDWAGTNTCDAVVCRGKARWLGAARGRCSDQLEKSQKHTFIRYGRTCLWFSAAALDSKTHNQPTRRAHHNGIVGQRGRTILTLYIDDRLADTAFVPTISSRSNLYGVAAFPFDDYTHRFVQMASLMDVYYAAVHQASTYTVYPYTRSCLIHDAGIRSNDSHVCASTSMAAMQGPDVYPFDVPLPCFTASLHPYISCRKHVKIRLRSRHSQVLLPHPVHAP